MLPSSIKKLLTSETAGSDNRVSVSGWVKSIRCQKSVSFAMISDGSTSNSLQAGFQLSLHLNTSCVVSSLTNGACVRLEGKLVDSPGVGQDKELRVEELQVLGACPPETYPIQKKELSLEYLRNNVHFRARTERIAAMLRLRDKLMQGIHSYFKSQEFVYIHTPILTANDTEGAGETFRIAPTKETYSDALSEFFSLPAHLTVSSQLHLEAFQTAMSRVYTLNPTFRAERSHTNRHLAEFWMLEAEWGLSAPANDGGDLQELCDVVEDLVRHTIAHAMADATCTSDIQLLNGPATSRVDALRSVSDALARWPRMTYTEAVGVLQARHAQRSFAIPPQLGASLASEHERYLAEEVIQGPVFITEYPQVVKAWYMRSIDPSREMPLVACFDLLVPHMGELAGGSVREDRYNVLKANMERYGLVSGQRNSTEETGASPGGPYDWYLSLRKHGSAPHGGFGIGFERFVGWVGGIEHVKECIPVPRTAGRIDL
ncbi:asparaginyl-tRNA synthetase [Fistulina hepatica ATCC 64428]|uniref:asparagine--tRNA ligase n=1 Tax=Fistulina hepatica ATCC 64428 TaxID=1128425 RepID=A0A0D7AC78_9AGAR|nr:asparaginyl-tRNA synthetase [Fistulina hepatica ATCC 64428]